MSDLLVCGDCVPAIAHDDFSHLDYFYDAEGAAMRQVEISEALGKIAPVFLGDADKDQPFSTEPCECCGERRPGRRFHCRTAPAADTSLGCPQQPVEEPYWPALRWLSGLGQPRPT